MYRSYKYRLYPTPAQRTALNKQLECCRWVYNKGLEVRRDAWQERQETPSLYDMYKMLTQWKAEHEWLKEGHSQATREALARLDLAFQHFFRRVRTGEKPGYPRFRSKDRYDSFTYPQERGNWNFLDSRHVRLSKIGNVKIKVHRPLEGTNKTLTVRRDGLGNWWACISCEIEIAPLPVIATAVGIDLGLRKFATLSTGEQIDNPRFFRREEKRIATIQRRLSKCDNGSPEYRKYKRAILHIHQRIVNRRVDFAHKLSHRLVNEFQIIVFEDMDIKALQSGYWRRLNKSISDAAWNRLVLYTTYKAEEAGRSCILVDSRDTSFICSRCGQIVEIELSCHVYQCPRCGLEMDRDLNASLNILARGLASLGQSLEAPS